MKKNKFKVNYIHNYYVKYNYDNRSLEKKAIDLIKVIIKNESIALGNVNIIFCNDEQILEYNKKYLSHDYFTDIVTFPYPEENYCDADILISLDSVLRNSKKFKTIFEKELCRVIIHGILHICGYNDSDTTGKLKMRKKEDIYLKYLK